MTEAARRRPARRRLPPRARTRRRGLPFTTSRREWLTHCIHLNSTEEPPSFFCARSDHKIEPAGCARRSGMPCAGDARGSALDEVFSVVPRPRGLGQTPFDRYLRRQAWPPALAKAVRPWLRAGTGWDAVRAHRGARDLPLVLKGANPASGARLGLRREAQLSRARLARKRTTCLIPELLSQFWVAVGEPAGLRCPPRSARGRRARPRVRRDASARPRDQCRGARARGVRRRTRTGRDVSRRGRRALGAARVAPQHGAGARGVRRGVRRERRRRFVPCRPVRSPAWKTEPV